MPDIDNELLAIKGLGWRQFREATTGRWLWYDHKGHTRHLPADFAIDAAACMELLRRLPDEWDIWLFHNSRRRPGKWTVRITDGEYKLKGYGESPILESAIAAAFTAYLRETK